MVCRRPERLKPKVEKICDVCRKSFITSNPRWKRCSKGCTDEWRTTEYNKYIYPYGITSKDYNELFKTQEGRCKFCRKHQSELKTKLNIDHCHKTGKVRGLLCNQCNQALGLLKENKDTIKRMLEYL